MYSSKDAILQELLVLRCQRGDEQAFTQLIRMWEKRLFFYIRRLVAAEEDAWDVLQQTWADVFQGIKSLKRPEQLPPWLYKIARYTAMRQWRGHYREQLHMAEKAQQLEASPESENCAFEDAEQVMVGLGRMTYLLEIGLTNAVLSAILAILVLAITRIWRNPHLANALWLIVLLKMVTPPIVSVPMAVGFRWSGGEILAILCGTYDWLESTGRICRGVRHRISTVAIFGSG